MQWDFTVLVLDNEKSELVVKSPVKVGKKSVAEEKVIAALKSHSEAERRRRERINAHLDTLRTLFPYREKEKEKWLEVMKSTSTSASESTFSGSPDIDDVSNAVIDSESPFGQNMGLKGSQHFEDDRDVDYSLIC
ncbi:transcription factor AIG1 isoform X1 [Gossypium hirsutum]|uniref:Transcription factor AIG1 isoform X1 n=1 Tax=Gossypium hirsutum TaxID=3635 RepID=A0ABM2YNZ7_GOSHI|nr:transcription factor AIG1-like isoform X1 [Gossypium hirsutum]